MERGREHLGTEGHRESDLVEPTLLWLRDSVATVRLQARQRVLQGALLLCAVGLLLWTSIFLYGSFYFSYMPQATYSTPVHYYYRTDCDSSASILCSFPIANISLLQNGKNQAMTYGQPYQISLELEMPESPANRELGMFMVKMSCYSRGGQTLTSSARSVRQLSSSSRFAMLHYRSSLLRTLGTLFFIPFFLSGMADQRQTVEVELFSEYIEDSYAPSIGAIIEIQSQRVQIYSSQLNIHAHFTGIRYFLYNYPVLSAVMGVANNFSFLSVLLFFSYLRLLSSQFIIPRQVRERISFPQRPARMDKSQDTDPEDEHSDPTEIESSSSGALVEAPVTASCLSQEEESSVIAGGDEMDVRQRFHNEVDLEETMEKQGETPKHSDSTLRSQIRTSACPIS
ncbi:seipin isoform X3 [Esox lucius]|uniref:Seipin n=1 Tax=Esox lucius TaxID=8010 RepID=A0A3P8XTK3_ESOLU|nr:seipin isoform X3 [Esox lucius]